MAVLADLETLPLGCDDDIPVSSSRSIAAESSHQLLTSKIMAVAILLGLGLVSTAAIVSREQSVGGIGSGVINDSPLKLTRE